MQIVINIPEEEYNIIKKSNAPMSWAEHLIKNGIPLPKGHGDLIDKNNLKYEKYNSYAYAIANAPTIIEGDRSEEE